jgi:hypothetical protein
MAEQRFWKSFVSRRAISLSHYEVREFRWEVRTGVIFRPSSSKIGRNENDWLWQCCVIKWERVGLSNAEESE